MPRVTERMCFDPEQAKIALHALDRAFTWGFSAEGREYWYGVYAALSGYVLEDSKKKIDYTPSKPPPLP